MTLKKILLFLISLVFGLAVFILVIREVGFKNIKQAFSLFSYLEGAAIIIVSFLISFLNILRWKYILKSQGYNIPIFNLAKVWFAGFSVNYLTPVAALGGEPFKIYSIKKIFSVDWEKGIASIFIEKLLGGVFYFLYLTFGVLSFFLLIGFPPKNIGITIGGILLISVIIILVLFHKIFKKESILKRFLSLFGIKNNSSNNLLLETEKEIFAFFQPRKKTIWQGVGITFLSYLMSFVRSFLIIFFLTGKTSILTAFSVYAFANLAYLFPIPAALGILEALETFNFGILGLGSNIGTVFSLILRGAELLICLAGVIFLVKVGIKLIIIRTMDKLSSFFER